MKANKTVNLVIKALEKLKGLEITVLDVSHKTDITDFMVICTGTSNRHVKSLANDLVEHVKLKKIALLGVESDADSEWILVDLGDIMVHIMQQRTRDYYGLEKRWG